ncbi:hypothetical protein AC91_0220 [Escherichia coli 6-175-07_S4_C1]|nr:hypothetical protein ECP030230813_1545 [Escherichia coli P0302308.13]KEM14102.1 hypothetical protein AC91_0220 [Escherichia coli 6-175-07_S4_C1]
MQYYKIDLYVYSLKNGRSEMKKRRHWRNFSQALLNILQQ